MQIPCQISAQQFSYDDAGNRITQLDVTPAKATSWAYGYDWLDRLETVKKAEAATVGALGALQLVSVYEYDAADNRIEFQVPNLDPDLTETFSYSFDDADNILSISKTIGTGSPSVIETFTSDADGNLKTRISGGVTTTYVWDDFNRLAAISTSDGSKKQSHTFGVSGFRRKKKDKNDVETTEYAESLTTAVAKNSAETVTYLMGHQILGFERASDGAMFWYVTDSLSSVRDVVNSSGTVVASYEFAEYGQRISSSESGVSSQKTFVGGLSVQDEVADTGLMMTGHRFYDPSLGRFLSRDPIGFAGGLNLYQYANSSPLRFVDPAGLQTGTAVDVIKMASDIARSYAARVSAAEAAAAAASAASDGPLPVGDAVALLILLRAMSGGHDLDPEALNNAFLGKHNAIQRPLWREIENRRRPLA